MHGASGLRTVIPNVDTPRSACAITGIVHLAALGMSAGVLAPGTPSGADLPARMIYVAADPRRWGMGWVAWMLAALTMVWFVVAIRDWLGDRGEPRRLRLASHLIVFGAAVETMGHVLAAGMLPSLAAAQQGPTFVAVERAIELSGAASAFCFAPGIGIVVASLARHPAIGRFTLGAGVLNVAGGFGMAFVQFAGETKMMPVATGAVVLTMAAFALSLARDVGPSQA